MAKLKYVKYQVTGENSPLLGKYLMRVAHDETIDLDALAEHISDHGSIYTVDVITGMLKKIRECIIELVCDSKKVKINGLGTFYLTTQCKAADSPDKLSANSVERVNLRFTVDGSNKAGLKGKDLRRKVSLVEDNEYSAPTTPNGGGNDANP